MTLDRARLSQIGSTLRRVRAGERQEPDGGKRVWHQGERGVEVISLVSAQGRVNRQEISADGALVVWSAGNPIITGALLGEPRRIGIAPSEQVVPDAQPRADVVALAIAVLDGAPVSDRYLTHLKVELVKAQEGMEAGLEKSVTSLRPTLTKPAEVTGAHPAPRSKVGWILAALATVAVLVLAGWYWAMHRP